jgi:hypothetical protein
VPVLAAHVLQPGVWRGRAAVGAAQRAALVSRARAHVCVCVCVGRPRRGRRAGCGAPGRVRRRPQPVTATPHPHVRAAAAPPPPRDPCVLVCVRARAAQVCDGAGVQQQRLDRRPPRQQRHADHDADAQAAADAGQHRARCVRRCVFARESLFVRALCTRAWMCCRAAPRFACSCRRAPPMLPR